MSTKGSLFNVQAPQEKGRWQFFAISYSVQLIAVVVAICLTIIGPNIETPLAKHVDLVAPDLTPVPKTPPRPQPRPVARMMAPKIPVHVAEVEAPVLRAPMPQRVQRPNQVPEIAQPVAPVPRFDSRVLAAMPTPKAPRVIATNTFGSSAAPTLQNVAPSRVQTGGFGDPNGLRANSRTGSTRARIAAAGSFDLPSGSGYGNGSGGSKGMRGTVASTGFGNGIAAQGGSRRGNIEGRVQSTGFGAVAAPAPAYHRARPSEALSVPVSIQSKPTPVYTAEARQLRVEGEVLLNVVFTAKGQLRVINVVRGLGHGLDEAAQRAAQGIRFTPAMREGQPVDFQTTIHIVFQLS